MVSGNVRFLDTTVASEAISSVEQKFSSDVSDVKPADYEEP